MSHRPEVTVADDAKCRCCFAIELQHTQATLSSELWGEKEQGFLKNLTNCNDFLKQHWAGQLAIESE